MRASIHGEVLFFATALFFGLATGCGSGTGAATGSTTPIPPTPPPATGPASGSEFLYSFRGDEKVYVASLVSETGHLSEFSDVTPANLPIELSVELPPIASSSGKYLYAPGWNNSPGVNAIFPFSITGAMGQLTAQSNYPVSFGGSQLVNGCIMDGLGRYFYASSGESWSSNTIQSLIIDSSSGTVRRGTAFEEPSPVGTFTVQAADPGGRFLYAYATYTGGIEIFVYTIDPNTGALSSAPNSPFPAASVDSANSDTFRFIQLFVSPSGKYLYLYYLGTPNFLGPQSHNIYIFAVDPSNGNLMQTSASPFVVPGAQGASLEFSPSGNLLYIPQRFWDSSTGAVTSDIALFKVSQSDGSISADAVSSVSNVYSNFLLDPSGKVLLIGPAGNNFQTFWSYLVDDSTGALTPAQGSPFFANDPIANSFQYSVIARIP